MLSMGPEQERPTGVARKGRAELPRLRTPPEPAGQAHGAAWLLRRTGLSGSLVYFSQVSAGAMGAAVLPGVQRNSTKWSMATPCPLQVGVISWGVVDVCKDKKPQRPVPAHARDFHINLFQVLPWLKEKLHDEDLGFL